jgi:hypothetical protein
VARAFGCDRQRLLCATIVLCAVGRRFGCYLIRAFLGSFVHLVHDVDGVAAAPGAEFGVDHFFAGFDGVFADAELGGDGADFEAQAHKFKNLLLAR